MISPRSRVVASDLALPFREPILSFIDELCTARKPNSIRRGWIEIIQPAAFVLSREIQHSGARQEFSLKAMCMRPCAVRDPEFPDTCKKFPVS